MKNILSTFLIVISFISSAQETTKAGKLSELYKELYEQQSFNGNLLVAEKGVVVFEESYGLANEQTNQKLNKNSIFELASVSKQFTAMGIVLLQKEGKLSYEDEISTFIPELAHYKGITIKNLLTHTGGLPDYMELAEKNLDKSKIATNADIIKLFAKLKPEVKFEPNEKWEYSNTGYLILASIIEKASDMSFGAYLKKKIFKPLKMDNTFVYRRRFEPKKIDNYAQGYIYSDSLKKKILPDELVSSFYVVYLDGIVGDGMVNSNLSDLLKWDRALYKNTLINDHDKDLIFSSYTTKDDSETDYGFGWMINNTKEYGKIVSHSGGWAGYITYIERNLDRDHTIIILQNNSTPKIEIPIKNTRRILNNQEVEKPITLESSLLQKYAGFYITEKGTEKEVVFENDKLFIPYNPEIKLELIPVSKTKFILDGFRPEVTYTFNLNENGEVIEYHLQQLQQDIDSKAKRKK